MEKDNKIAVLGGGLWGTVLAQQLAMGSRRQIFLWEFFGKAADALGRTRRHPHIPGFRLDENIVVTSDLSQAVQDCGVLLVVLPSSFVRGAAKSAARILKHKPVVVNASKGVELKTLMTMGDVIAQELPARAVYTLSGPSFAREVARGVSTKLVLAGPQGAQSAALARLFKGPMLSITPSSDRRGVELGGSLKNVLAIGAGILDGLGGQGANTKAALIIQGLSEMSSIIAAEGGKRETVYGLSGLGDLIATGTSPESRNRAFGEHLGRGKTPGAAERAIKTVVEGIEASESAHALARRGKLSTPLIDAIWKAVHQGKPARGVMKSLGF